MNNALLFFIESSIALSVLYFLYFMILRNDTFFSLKRFFLLAIIIISAIIPFIRFNSQAEDITQYHHILEPITIYADNINTTINSEPVLFHILLTIYFLGVFFFTLRFVFMMISLRKKMNQSEKKYLNGRKVYLTNFSGDHFSFFGRIFICESESEEDIESIVAHEYAHVKNYHSFDILLVEFFTILFWFNPVVYLIKRALRMVHEFQADDHILQKGYDKIKYQNLLISNIVGVKTSLLTNNFNKSFLVRRFKMMAKLKTPSWTKTKIVLFLPIIGLLVFLFSCVKEEVSNMKKPIGIEMKSSTGSIENIKENNFASYQMVDIIPQFPGGEQQLLRYIAENVKYPESARQNGIEGKVYVGFVINKYGKVKNITIKRGVNEAIDSESIRVISNLPDWTPGYNDEGEPVNVAMVIPINFKLS
jgi:TonB family protein